MVKCYGVLHKIYITVPTNPLEEGGYLLHNILRGQAYVLQGFTRGGGEVKNDQKNIEYIFVPRILAAI